MRPIVITFCRPFDYCTLNPIDGTISPMWDWLANSTYKEGTYEYKGKLLGVWTYEVSRKVTVLIL